MKRLTHKQTMTHLNGAVQRARDLLHDYTRTPYAQKRTAELLAQRVSVLKFAAAMVREQANGAPHGK